MYDFPINENILEEIAGVGLLGTFNALFYIFILGMPIAAYVLQSLGLYTTAQRRGLKKPWLAWIPMGDMWILGSISDQYQYIVQRKNKNKRKALLILTALMWVAYAIIMVLLVSMLVSALEFANPMPNGMWYALVKRVLGILGTALVLLGLGVAVAVIRYMALYDLYRSCEPNNATVYLVVGILVTLFVPYLAIVESAIVFLCRNKDLGMPPRKDAAQAVQEPPTIPEDEA